MAFAVVFAAPWLGSSAALELEQDQQQLVALRSADLRVHRIFFRLARDNAALCRKVAPSIGAALHARDNYRGDFAAAAKALFGFTTPVAIEGVVAAGPADLARLQANDGIVTIGGLSPQGGGVNAVPSTLDLIERDGADGRVQMVVDRGESRYRREVETIPICAARIELTVSGALDAGTDGRTIQVSTGLVNAVDDDGQLAAVIAHELAHAVLEHPERLTAAGVSRGLLREFGKNRRLIRRTEEEADRMSVYLLNNTDFDPRAAERFWRGTGRRVSGGLFAGTTHMRWQQRAELVANEAARIAATEASAPMALMATRDQPLE